MGFFKPGWMNRDYKKACRAIDKITDEARLEKIAVKAQSDDIRLKAAGRISDPTRLLNIFMSRENYTFRRAMLVKINDQAILGQIAANTGVHAEIRNAAISKLTNPDVLRAFALAGNGAAVRNPNFQDKDLLERFALTSADADIRVSAIQNRNLTDSGIFMQIIINDDYVFAREEAIRKLQACDKRTIISLALRTDSVILRRRLYDKCPALQSFNRDLNTVLWQGGSHVNRFEAAKRIIQTAVSEPDVVLPFWDELKEEIEKEHKESVGSYPKAYDGEGSDYTVHYGIGLRFPDKPQRN